MKKPMLMPLEPTEEILRVMLAVRYPATYKDYLRNPMNEIEMYKATEADILETTKQYRAAIQAGQLLVQQIPYHDVLKPFNELMRRELAANSGKGDRPAWLQMTPDTCLLEIYYHLGKLQKALRGPEMSQVTEYAVDTANLCMMLLDICGVLDHVPEDDPVKVRKPELPANTKRAKTSLILRAMAANYKNGHQWDHLDEEAVLAAADELDHLANENVVLRQAVEAAS